MMGSKKFCKFKLNFSVQNVEEIVNSFSAVGSRFNDDFDEEDEGYETIASSCDAIRSTIRPSTLPNVKGEMTEVYQSTKFLQEIHIEKCA